MRIVFTGDWHLDLANLDRTVKAAEEVTEIILRESPDVVVNLGDLVVSRGAVHPHVSWHLRRIVQEQAAGRRYIILKGNHDDSYHADRRDTLWGVFGGQDLETAAGMGNVALVSSPRVIRIGDGSEGPSLVMIPAPNKHDVAAWRENHPESGGGPEGMMEAVIAGLIAEATGRGRVVACCHGTISGAKLSNEQMMPAGPEYGLPRHAFRGADLVMGGHIHHPQDWIGGPEHPPGYYVGSISALTWGEKHRPRVLMLDTETMDVTSVDLSCQQMIQRDVDLTGQGDPLGHLGKVVVESAEKDARLRLVVRGPQATLSIITNDWARHWIAPLNLSDITIVKEPTDQALVRMEVDRSWTVDDAFRAWLKYREVPEAEQDQLLKLAREVEQSVRDEHLDARYDFEPQRLELFNWCQYQSVTVDMEELRGLVSVVGQNTAGKSNLARAVIFALFRKQLSGRTTASLVRRGEQAGRVILDWKSHGVLYRVIRDIRISGRGVARVDSSFLVADQNGAWQPAAEGTATETQRAIDRLVGPWELFSWTNWAGQNEVGRLLHLTPAELKEVLLAVLQRNWDARIEYAKNEIRKLEVEHAEAKGRADKAEETRRRVGEARDAVGASSDVLKTAERELAEIPEPDGSELARAREEYAALLAEYRTLTNGLGGSSVKADLEHVVSRRGSLAMRLEAMGPRRDIDDLLKRLSEVRGKKTQIERDMVERHNEHVAKQRVHNATIAESRDRLKFLSGAVERDQKKSWEAADGLNDANRELAAARKQSDLIDTVPCGGVEWVHPGVIDDPDGYDHTPVDMGKCKFLKQAIEARTLIPKLETHVDDATAAIKSAAADLEESQRVRRECEESIAILEASWLEAEGAREGLKKADSDILAKLSDKETEISALVGLERSRIAIVEEVDSLSHTIESLTKRVAEHESMARRASEKQIELNVMHSRVKGLEERHERDRRNHGTAVRHVAACREKVAKAQGTLEALAEQLESLKGVEDEIRENQRVTVLWKKYVEAMHRDGLPFTMLEKFALPQLASAMNRYLEQTEIRVTIASERTLQTGDQRNEVVMTFTDQRGTHDVSSASGFQESAIGLSFVAGIGDLAASATGSVISWFAVDEGLGTMDPANLDKAKATLKAIAETRKSFWIISHVGGIDEAADRVVRVEMDGSTSVIEVS